MEENKILNESLQKIHGLMYYDNEFTATENTEIIEEQYAALLAADAAFLAGQHLVRKNRQNKGKPVSGGEVVRIVRELHRNLKDRKIQIGDNRRMKMSLYRLKLMVGRTLDGESAIEGIKKEYERKYGGNLIQDVESNLDNLNYKGASSQKELLGILSADEAGAEPTAEPGVEPTAQASATYVPCQGGINKYGCKSDSIAQVQQLVGLKPDGMFGPKTQAKLGEVIPEFSKQFTDADIPTIQAKLKPTEAPRDIAPSKISPKMANVLPKTEMPTFQDLHKSNTPQYQAQATPSKKDQRVQKRIDKLGNKLSMAEEDGEEVEVKEDMFEKPEVKPGGYNMSQGFVNESISQKERVRKNKQDRLNKKLGVV